MNTLKTPAEAAFAAYYDISTPPFRQNDFGPDSAWDFVAKAAIDAHLATVAEGLPTVLDMFDARDKETPMRSIRALFTERFAKLQAELAHEKNLSRAFQIDGDGLRKKLFDVTAERDELQQALSGKTISCSNCNVLAAERDTLRQRLTKKNEQIRAVLDVLESLGWNGVENSKIASVFLTNYVGDKDAEIAQLQLEADERRETISAMNERLIERTKGFMARLAEKTKRERYVPLEDHEGMKRMAVDALETCEEYFKDRIDADHNGTHFVGNEESSKYNEVTEALTKLKGTK